MVSSKVYYFSKETANMGYREPPTNVTQSYDITISNDTILFGGQANVNIDFIPGNSYIFRQNDASNKNRFLTFTRMSDANNIFTDNLTIVGDPGHPDSYFVFTVPDTEENAVTDLVYDYLDTSGIDTTVSGDSYTPPTFEVRFPIESDASNLFMSLNEDLSFSFGNNSGEDVSYSILGTFDLSNVASSSGTLANDSTISFSQNLANHGGVILYIDNRLYFRRYIPYKKYTVTVSNDQFYFDNGTGPTESPTIYNHVNGNYLFDQTDPTNDGHRLLFSTTDPTGTSTPYTDNVSLEGTVGTSNGFTLLQIPSDQDLYYYSENSVNMGNRFNKVTLANSYALAVETNGLGESVYAVYDETDQDFHKQRDLDISSAGVYYFDVSHVSNAGEQLAFGETPDGTDLSSNTVYGFDGSYVYLDARNVDFS